VWGSEVFWSVWCSALVSVVLVSVLLAGEACNLSVPCYEPAPINPVCGAACTFQSGGGMCCFQGVCCAVN